MDFNLFFIGWALFFLGSIGFLIFSKKIGLNKNSRGKYKHRLIYSLCYHSFLLICIILMIQPVCFFLTSKPEENLAIWGLLIAPIISLIIIINVNRRWNTLLQGNIFYVKRGLFSGVKTNSIIITIIAVGIAELLQALRHNSNNYSFLFSIGISFAFELFISLPISFAYILFKITVLEKELGQEIIENIE